MRKLKSFFKESPPKWIAHIVAQTFQNRNKAQEEKNMAAAADISKAVELYYSRAQLDSDDVSDLFGGVSRSTVCHLKQKARNLMKEKGLPIWDSKHVETKAAFEAWGLDIEDLEKRFKKLRALGFIKGIEQ